MGTNNFNAKTQRRKVAERQWKLASYEVAGGMKKNKCPERTKEASGFQRPFRTQFLARVLPATMWLANFRSPCGTKTREPFWLMGFNIFKANVSNRTKGKLATPQLLLELI